MGGACDTSGGKGRAAYTVLVGMPEVRRPSVMHILLVITM